MPAAGVKKNVVLGKACSPASLSLLRNGGEKKRSACGGYCCFCFLVGSKFGKQILKTKAVFGGMSSFCFLLSLCLEPLVASLEKLAAGGLKT